MDIPIGSTTNGKDSGLVEVDKKIKKQADKKVKKQMDRVLKARKEIEAICKKYQVSLYINPIIEIRPAEKRTHKTIMDK